VSWQGRLSRQGAQAQRQKLSPEDIYLRVTYGYRRMPAWEELFTDDERMAITAYMKSRRFSN
jgi:hypothetical protein